MPDKFGLVLDNGSLVPDKFHLQPDKTKILPVEIAFMPDNYRRNKPGTTNWMHFAKAKCFLFSLLNLDLEATLYSYCLITIAYSLIPYELYLVE